MAPEVPVAFLSTFPPRPCGIATFTADLSDAVARAGRVAPRIAAIAEEGAVYRYPRQVRWRIDQQDRASWRDAARAINDSDVALVSVQHEFGIVGRFARDGRFVDHLPCFLEELRKPVVTTLHTVLPNPRPDLREPIRSLHDRSEAVVTMVNMARLILEEDYGLDAGKLYTIPHGVPEIERVPVERAKRAMQLAGRTVLMTFGLLSSGKGIQHVIRALPEVVPRHPDLLYLVVGGTHPEIRRREGERYRNSLMELARRLGLERHVRFVNRYLTQEELISYLQATDIYLTPYVNRDQITSGTLAYALGCGKAVISTPYLYAAEVLAEGRGLLAEFDNPASIARCVNLYLDDAVFRHNTEERALAYGQEMAWSRVGERYAALFRRVAAGEPLA
jgi:glycosyltransferase involved in cell wall biosynthesis